MGAANNSDVTLGPRSSEQGSSSLADAPKWPNRHREGLIEGELSSTKMSSTSKTISLSQSSSVSQRSAPIVKILYGKL